MKKILVFILLLLSGLFGCSPHELTKIQRAEVATACGSEQSCIDKRTLALREQNEYERNARRAEERDKIRALIVSCEQMGRVLIYTGHSSGSRPSARQGEVYIPRHARLFDYQCLTSRDAVEALRRYGIGY
jgi:hypothetical protein